MLFSVRTKLVVISLAATTVLSLTVLSSNRAQAQAAPAAATHVTRAQPNKVISITQQAQVIHQRKEIAFWRQADWRLEAIYGRHTPSKFVERHVTSLAFLHWDKHHWHGLWLSAKHYLRANPWANMLRRTYAYRMCLIGHESANAGRYKAENGGTRGVEGPGFSNASGAYQFLDPTWQSQFANAKRYFRGKLKGRWTHAADAPPKVQDIVAAYDIAAAIMNGHDSTDWTYPDCQAKGLAPA